MTFILQLSVGMFAAWCVLELALVRARRDLLLRYRAYAILGATLLLLPVGQRLGPDLIPVPPIGTVEGTLDVVEPLDIGSGPAEVPSAAGGASALPESGLRSGSGEGVAPAPDAPTGGPGWQFALLVIYLAGTGLLLHRLALGMVSGRRLVRGGADVTDVVATRAEGRIQVPEHIRVLESEQLPSPMTLALFRTRVLLPKGWRQWPPETLSAVLAHEFSHVRRHDHRIRLVLLVSRALYWFHPLPWVLSRGTHRLAEYLADAEASATAGGAKEYAEILLDIAREAASSGRRFPAPSTPMAAPADLRARVDRLLAHRSRSPVGSRKAGRRGWRLAAAVSVPILVACATHVPGSSPAAPSGESPSWPPSARGDRVASWRHDGRNVHVAWTDGSRIEARNRTPRTPWVDGEGSVQLSVLENSSLSILRLESRRPGRLDAILEVDGRPVEDPEVLGAWLDEAIRLLAAETPLAPSPLEDRAPGSSPEQVLADLEGLGNDGAKRQLLVAALRGPLRSSDLAPLAREGTARIGSESQRALALQDLAPRLVRSEAGLDALLEAAGTLPPFQRRGVLLAGHAAALGNAEAEEALSRALQTLEGGGLGDPLSSAPLGASRIRD